MDQLIEVDFNIFSD